MPFQSERQRRYIYAQAAQGVSWAIRFLEDMGLHPPTRVKKKHKKVRRH